MRTVSLRAQRQNRRRRKREQELFAARPWCARCCRTDRPLHGHERLSRAQGGNPEHPDCLLCDPCNRWCEDYPALAAATGWKISGKYQRHSKLARNEAWDLNHDIVRFEAA